MPVRFFLEGYLGSLERTMQLPPNFTPRGGGGTKGYQYSAADCNCRFCIHAPKPRTSCSVSMTDCPCFTERLESGCVSAADLIASLLPDIRSAKLRQRFCGLIAERPVTNIFFANTHHQSLFNHVIKDGGLRHSNNTGLLATLLEDLSEYELVKLEGAVLLTDCKTPEDCAKLLYNLDSFELTPNVDDYESLGRHFAANDFADSLAAVPPEMMGHFDYDLLGRMGWDGMTTPTCSSKAIMSRIRSRNSENLISASTPSIAS